MDRSSWLVILKDIWSSASNWLFWLFCPFESWLLWCNERTKTSDREYGIGSWRREHKLKKWIQEDPYGNRGKMDKSCLLYTSVCRWSNCGSIWKTGLQLHGLKPPWRMSLNIILITAKQVLTGGEIVNETAGSYIMKLMHFLYILGWHLPKDGRSDEDISWKVVIGSKIFALEW